MKNDSRDDSGETFVEAETSETDEDAEAGMLDEEDHYDNAEADTGFARSLWLILSALFIFAAVILLLLSRKDAAFVVAALGIATWFWNMRVRLKRQYNIRNRR